MLFCILVVMGIFGIREYHLLRLRGVLRDQAARGLPTTFEELLALAPAVDPALQAEYAAACAPMEGEGRQDLPGGDGWDSPFNDALAAFVLGEASGPPEGLREALERHRPAVERLTSLVREGKVLPTGLGALPRERPGGLSSAVALDTLSLPTLAPGRAVRWHRLDALLGGDPGTRIDAIESWIRAWREPAVLTDALLGIELRLERERLHLELALQGRLPAGRAEAFLAEETGTASWMATFWKWNRLLFPCMVAEDLLERRHPSELRIGGGLPWAARKRDSRRWLLLPEAVGDTLVLYDDTRRALEREAGAPAAAALQEREAGIRVFPLDPAAFSLRFAAFAEARSRAVRAALRLLLLRAERGGLPADEAEARRWLGPHAGLLDGTPTSPRIRYGRPAPGVLRLAADASGGPEWVQVPGEDVPGRWAPGDPPSKAPLRVALEGVEIRTGE
ncbi:MAG: hypothetical protein L6R43_12355 [Planctomycetes bacterium]|nr:hypothetical protein [Planctomycetota bacterium]